MQITLIQSEIEEAIKAYLLTQLTVQGSPQISVEFRATRGDTGIQAIVDVAITSTASKAGRKPRAVITTQDLKRIQEEEASADTLEGAQAEEGTEIETDQSMAEETAEEDASMAVAEPLEAAPTPAPAPAAPRPVASVGPSGLRLNKPAQAPATAPVQSAGGTSSAPAKKLFAGFSKPSNPPGE